MQNNEQKPDVFQWKMSGCFVLKTAEKRRFMKSHKWCGKMHKIFLREKQVKKRLNFGGGIALAKMQRYNYPVILYELRGCSVQRLNSMADPRKRKAV